MEEEKVKEEGEREVNITVHCRNMEKESLGNTDWLCVWGWGGGGGMCVCGQGWMGMYEEGKGGVGGYAIQGFETRAVETQHPSCCVFRMSCE